MVLSFIGARTLDLTEGVMSLDLLGLSASQAAVNRVFGCSAIVLYCVRSRFELNQESMKLAHARHRLSPVFSAMSRSDCDTTFLGYPCPCGGFIYSYARCNVG